MGVISNLAVKAAKKALKDDLEVRWSKLRPKHGDLREDALDGVSEWSQNTFDGADKLLYGEAFYGDKKVGRVMVGVNEHPLRGTPLEVDKIWVHPDHRRTGIATRMLEEAKTKTGHHNIYGLPASHAGEALLAKFPRTDIDPDTGDIYRARGGRVSSFKVKR